MRTIGGCLGLLLLSTLSACALAFTGVLWSISSRESERLSAQAQATATDIRASLDRELDGIIGMLQALASSPSLASGDLASFYGQAKTVLKQRGSVIAIRRPDGQQVLNTLVPFGSPLPLSTDPVLRSTDKEALQSRQPKVSDLYLGAVSKRLFVLIVVPVVIENEVRYLVNIAIEPEQLRNLIGRKIQPDWTASIVDGNSRVIARSRQQERFLGQVATADVREKATGEAGTWEATNLEGTSTLASYSKSQLSNWRVVVGIPTVEFSRPLVRSMSGLAAGALLALVVSGMLAAFYSKVIKDAVKNLETASMRVGELGQVDLKPTGLAEIDAVGHVLQESAGRLKDLWTKLTSEQASAAELTRRFVAAEEAASGFIFQRDLDTGQVWHSEGFKRLLGYDHGEIVPTYEGWCRIIHPDDAGRFRHDTERDTVIAAGGFRGEYRVRHKDGRYVWLWVRARTDPDDRLMLLTGSVVDVTKERAEAEHRELLLHELAHRGKNMLAMIQSVAKHSIGKADPELTAAFTSRIQAIGATYSALLQAEWRGLRLDQIIDIGAAGCQCVDRSGPEIWVHAKAAQTLTLIVHELACNLRHQKHGGEHHPRVEWSVAADQRFTFSWREDGVSAPEGADNRKGFGTFLLETVVPIEFDTTPVYEISGGRVEYRFTTSLGRVGDMELPPARSEQRVPAAHKDVPEPETLVLLVEDEPLIGLDAKAILEELGYLVEGPVMTLDMALKTAGERNWSAALLDVNLSGEKVWPVARLLIERRVRVAFLTGYASLAGFPEDLVAIPRIEKPVQKSSLQKFFPPVTQVAPTRAMGA